VVIDKFIVYCVLNQHENKTIFTSKKYI
jgi:hypothetical protein